MIYKNEMESYKECCLCKFGWLRRQHVYQIVLAASYGNRLFLFIIFSLSLSLSISLFLSLSFYSYCTGKPGVWVGFFLFFFSSFFLSFFFFSFLPAVAVVVAVAAVFFLSFCCCCCRIFFPFLHSGVASPTATATSAVNVHISTSASICENCDNWNRYGAPLRFLNQFDLIESLIRYRSWRLSRGPTSKNTLFSFEMSANSQEPRPLPATTPNKHFMEETMMTTIFF